KRRDGLLDFRLLAGGYAGRLFERLFDRVDGRIRLIARLDELLATLVLFGMRFRLPHHALDVDLGEAARRLDTDGLFLAAGLVLRRHIHDSIRVDVERHLDLRQAERGGRDADEVELSQEL